MPAAIACPKCKKRYNLPDKLLGKAVKCTACETQFKTPAPKASAQSKQRPSISPQQIAAQQKAQAQAQQQAAELKKLGIDSPIRDAPDVFAGAGALPGTPDPLANHMIEDPGFGDHTARVAAADDTEQPDDPMASMFANPALAPKKKNRVASSSKRKNTGGMTSQPWFLLTAVFVPLFAISIVFSLTELIPANVNTMITTIVYGLFGLAGFVLGIWGLMLVYEASESILQVLLCLFIPFYIIYFIVVNWEIMKPYAFALIASILISPLAVAAIVMAGVMNAGEA